MTVQLGLSNKKVELASCAFGFSHFFLFASLVQSSLLRSFALFPLFLLITFQEDHHLGT